jgi:multidrug efflux pump subunit AcrB
MRDKSSKEISKEIREFLKIQDYKKRFSLSNLMVVEKKMGHSKADVRIGVVSDDYQKALKAISELKKGFKAIEGIKYFGDNVKLGIDEIKLKVNPYGETLGVTERYIGNYVSDLFLSKKIATIFDENELVDVKIKSKNYDKNLQSFKSLQIPLKDGTLVRLSDICEFETIQSLEQLVKDDGETSFYVFANVDAKVITASEVIDRITPITDKLQKDGIELRFKGERENTQTLKTEMLLASVLAIALIFISILYLFNSFRETLIVMSVIPFSLLGIFIGHFIMGLNISLPSLIGALGLAGVIVNDGIIMMSTLNSATDKQSIYTHATKRFRPIILTSITTIIGLSSLIFFATSEAVSFQPLAVTLGFGLLWGTVLNLLYLPTMYNFVKSFKYE